MAQLAIQGHRTRGSEVVALLGMLGGYQCGYPKEAKTGYWFIDRCNNIVAYDVAPTDLYDDFIILTLEEFETRFPYKVGNKVTYYGWDCTVIGMEWENNTNTILYTVKGIDFSQCTYVEYLQPHKEEKSIPPYMDYDVTTKEQPKELLIGMIKDKNGDWELNTHKDYEIKEVDGKFKLIKKQSKYPKTFIEVLNFWHPDRQIEDDYQRCYKKDLIENFQDLLYARDAYWKIAGDQMGLDKPWEPDYNEESYEQGSPIKYVIYYTGTYITKGVKCTPSHILAFPTKEMRDAFYENFKDLIEKCKEFL